MENTNTPTDLNSSPIESDDWNSFLLMLGVDKNAVDIHAEDIVNKSFDSVELWETFYKLYSLQIGFSYRKHGLKKDGSGNLISRTFTCSKEGYRRSKDKEIEEQDRQPRGETRCGCKASLRVRMRQYTNEWVAREFVKEHNHECVPPQLVRFLPQNRCVADDVVAACKSMKRVGMKTCHIIDFMAMELGGHDKLPFQRKDVYNRLDQVRSLANLHGVTDSQGALGYLQCLARQNCGDFFCVYNVDEENRLCNIFWADRTSRLDYEAFGSVIAFDTTYRTNKYNKPLLIIVGVNHHFKSCIFGLALLYDETVDSFVWVLENLMKAMNHKKPLVVLTDGDNAMRSAILQVFPEVIHRLCSWHILENASKHVHNVNFNKDLSHLMFEFFTPEEFLTRWNALITAYDLTANEWAATLFDKRHSWAETYLRGHFFAGMRTTQRSESINALIRKYLDRTKTLRDFVACIDFAISRLRESELKDDFETKHTSPQLPARDILLPLYKQASIMFTRSIYNKVQKELQQHMAYSVRITERHPDRDVYTLSKYPQGDLDYIVSVQHHDHHVKCSCLKFETIGYPCRHIFPVLKFLNMTSIPDSLILKRWTKDAKAMCEENNMMQQRIPQEVVEMTRYATLSSSFNKVAYYALKNSEDFQETKNELNRLCSKFEQQRLTQQTNLLHSGPNAMEDGDEFESSIIRDPIFVRTKGTANHTNTMRTGSAAGGSRDTGKRKCGLCKGFGHNKQTCPLRQQTSNDDPSSRPFNTTEEFIDPRNEDFCSRDAIHHLGTNSEVGGYGISNTCELDNEDMDRTYVGYSHIPYQHHE